MEEIQRASRVRSLEERLDQSAKDLKAFLKEHMSARQALKRSSTPENDFG